MRRARAWSAVVLVVASLGCTRRDAGAKKLESETKETPEHEHDGLPKVVHVTPDVFASAKMAVAPATVEALASSIVLPGEVVADPDRSGRISSTVAGRVEDVRFKDGATVKAGDIVVVLRVPDVGKVRGAYGATTGKAKAARANAERLKELVHSRLASEQAYLDAEAEARALETEASALGEQLDAVGGGSGVMVNLRAPVSGTVVRRDVVVGQPVTAEQSLGSIADLGEAWFLGRVFEKDLGHLHEGAAAEVELNAYPGERFGGKIELLGQQIDPIARTLTARIRLTNRKGLLRLGLFGAARVASGDGQPRKPVLAVPRSAVTEIAGKSVVFVRTGEETFDVHEIVTGQAAVGKVEVLSGLQAGENVVTHGVFTLKSIVLKGTFAEEEE